MKLSEIPIRINWFANPAGIAKAFGLRIELPDLEIEDPDYWNRFDRDAWRAGLRGKVAMTDEELRRVDADWVRIKLLGQYAEVWFDIEEGIVISGSYLFGATAADLAWPFVLTGDVPVLFFAERHYAQASLAHER